MAVAVWVAEMSRVGFLPVTDESAAATDTVAHGREPRHHVAATHRLTPSRNAKSGCGAPVCMCPAARVRGFNASGAVEGSS